MAAPSTPTIAYLNDSGLLEGRWPHPDSRWAWLLPPLYRLIEYSTVLAVGLLITGSGPLTYGALAALAFRHYDLVYRARTLGPVSIRRWPQRLLGGWQIRTLLVAGLAAIDLARPALAALAFWVAVVAVADTVVAWRRAGITAVAGDVDEDEGL